jgi:hypothetical protein
MSPCRVSPAASRAELAKFEMGSKASNKRAIPRHFEPTHTTPIDTIHRQSRAPPLPKECRPMNTRPLFHIAVMQPTGYVHSLGFLDQARYVRYQLRRLGCEVSLAKNRLREDAVNLVFGAHLGFPSDWTVRNACIFVNLEQLGKGGADVGGEYLRLLRSSAVAEYDTGNIAAYGADPADVPILPFLHAPYLHDGQALPLAERPIDLLFFGSMNARRRKYIDRVEACGVKVAMFDQPIYGPERDHFIRQAKAVLNCHFYETSRFEQVRVSHCLSLGTPVISERVAAADPGVAFEESVFWLRDDDLVSFFRKRFGKQVFFDQAADKLAAFAQHDPIEAYADLVGFAAGYMQGHLRTRSGEAWRPRALNLGSGKDYKPGWLNIDIIDRAEPDLVLDLGKPLSLPIEGTSRFGAPVLLERGGLAGIHANNVLEHVPDLPMLMGNALALLEEGGVIEIEVPYEKAPTAWQDPTHLRALNENSWIYYTDWFWYLGWFEYRFEMASSSWLDLQLQPCRQEQAAFMRVLLHKVATTPQERNRARVMQADFGGVADDAVPAHAMVRFSEPSGETMTASDAVRVPAPARVAAAAADAAA